MAVGTVRGYPEPSPQRPRFGIDPRDQRPDTLFRWGAASAVALLGGGALMAGVHAALGAVLIVLAIVTPDHVQRVADARLLFEREPPEVQFVEARLIKLGREFDPRELPNRIREARTTAPRQPSKVPRHGAERIPRPDAGPLDSVEGALAILGTRADQEARIAQAAEQEGDPDGVAEGDATREEGDVYRTYLYGFFRRGFNMPTSITDEDRRGLYAIARIQTSPVGIIDGFDITRPSGNGEFDQAVRLRLDQAVGAQLRDPPEAERALYFGTAFSYRFTPPR